jgi:hypothetical protein
MIDLPLQWIDMWHVVYPTNFALMRLACNDGRVGSRGRRRERDGSHQKPNVATKSRRASIGTTVGLVFARGESIAEKAGRTSCVTSTTAVEMRAGNEAHHRPRMEYHVFFAYIYCENV